MSTTPFKTFDIALTISNGSSECATIERSMAKPSEPQSQGPHPTHHRNTERESHGLGHEPLVVAAECRSAVETVRMAQTRPMQDCMAQDEPILVPTSTRLELVRISVNEERKRYFVEAENEDVDGYETPGDLSWSSDDSDDSEDEDKMDVDSLAVRTEWGAGAAKPTILSLLEPLNAPSFPVLEDLGFPVMALPTKVSETDSLGLVFIEMM